jgi:hypothetical protein
MERLKIAAISDFDPGSWKPAPQGGEIIRLDEQAGRGGSQGKLGYWAGI